MTNTEKSTTESLVVTELKKQEEKKAEDAKKPFAPGVSGNPTGRPKGAKGKATLLREAVLLKSEDFVLRKWMNIVETTVKLAEEGDTRCLKILWDRMIPSQRAVDTDATNKKDMDIHIHIEGLTVKKVNDIDADMVEAEITEIKDGD